MDGVEFFRAPLLGQYFSIRDTGIFGYPHKRRVAGDKRAMWCHAWVRKIAEALTRLSAQEDRETLPLVGPDREARKLSGARRISQPEWTRKASERLRLWKTLERGETSMVYPHGRRGVHPALAVRSPTRLSFRPCDTAGR